MLWYLAGYQFVRDISETVVLMEHPREPWRKLAYGQCACMLSAGKIEIKKGRYTTKEEQQNKKKKENIRLRIFKLQ